MSINDGRKLKRLIFATFFLFIAVFAFFRSSDLIFGIKIRDINITNGQTVSESTLGITGNAKNALNLTLNGREISIDLGGNFEETIALNPGYNIVSIRAVDKFGYTDEKTYQLMYKVEGS